MEDIELVLSQTDAPTWCQIVPTSPTARSLNKLSESNLRGWGDASNLCLFKADSFANHRMRHLPDSDMPGTDHVLTVLQAALS